MKLEIGIDEAGYGPTLGPLVLGLVAVRRAEEANTSLYQSLGSVVGRMQGRGQRLAVDDSKKVYSGRRGLEHLERTALAFAGPSAPRPTCLEELCGERCQPEPARWPAWYRRQDEAAELPSSATDHEVDAWRQRLSASLADQGIELVVASPVAVLEPAFNESVERTGNKAASLLGFVSPLIRDLPARYPQDEVVIRVDRLGGRRYYEEFLGGLFPLRAMRKEVESSWHSEYVLRDGDRDLRISFETKADGRHFAVALASILAKYTREMFLRRLNGHFARQVPDLAPTAGYPQDAARFLDDIAGVVDAQQRRQLVRRR